MTHPMRAWLQWPRLIGRILPKSGEARPGTSAGSSGGSGGRVVVVGATVETGALVVGVGVLEPEVVGGAEVVGVVAGSGVVVVVVGAVVVVVELDGKRMKTTVTYKTPSSSRAVPTPTYV